MSGFGDKSWRLSNLSGLPRSIFVVSVAIFLLLYLGKLKVKS